MSFWKKLFSVEETPRADGAEIEPVRTPAPSNPHPSSIHEAARNGELENVKALLQDNPDLVFSKDDKRNTPLHHAARRNKKDVAEFLLANKAEVNARADVNYTPLHQAAEQGHYEVATVLLANNAEVNARNNFGCTPLHSAALQGHKSVVELLLLNNADANAKGASGDTPLGNAIERGHNAVAELLRQHGGYTEASQISDAAQSGDLGRVYTLLKASDGQTPLHVAAGKGYEDAAELLLGNGADVNAKDQFGATPLHAAIELPGLPAPLINSPGGRLKKRGNRALVELLIANKADIDAKDKHGVTPLHLAAYHGYGDIAELLLANHAQVDGGAISGETPLREAAHRGFNGIVELLLAHGARIDAKIEKGGAPSDQAAVPTRIHGLFDVAKLTELARSNKCLMCGASMQKSASGFSLTCGSGHEEIHYFAFDNSYATQSKQVADDLAAKGCRVQKAEGREQWNIFVC
jgi:ankyrin repeat protein